MTLVERFIEISNWPTSRKTVLLAAVGFFGHLFAWPVLHFGYAHLPSPAVNLELIVWLNVTGTSAALLPLLIALPSAVAGREARWTAYLLVTLYGTFVAFLMHLAGSASTVLGAFFPILALFWGLYFGAAIAWYGLAYATILIVALVFLETSGVLSYAPLLIDRSIDAHRNGFWFALSYYPVLQIFILVFVLMLLLISARQLQEARLNAANRQLERSSQLIRRYVPTQVADAILSGNEQITGPHERRRLTIFFSDLVGFTELSEDLEPEDLSRVLNEYFSEMTAIAQKHGGTVDELSGDAILVFFGAPHATNDRDHALQAVRMAMEMQRAVSGLNDKWRKSGTPVALEVRMGVNTGVVTVGNFGSPERMKYAALGKHVNLAARIQAACEPNKVLLSHTTWLLVSDSVHSEPKGEIQFKGFHKPVMVYEAIAESERAQQAVPGDGLASLGRA